MQHHLDPKTAFEAYDITQLDAALQESYQYRSDVLQTLDPLVEEPLTLTDSQVGDLMAFLYALSSPSAMSGCDLVPDSVPSSLPVDVDPDNPC